MYRFLILAFDRELTKAEMEEHYVPGSLTKVTEIWLIAEDAAKALSEARKIIIAQNYHIRRIDQILDNPTRQGGSQLPGANMPLP